MASTGSPTLGVETFDSKALSRPSSRKGRMENPLSGNVTVWPSPMSLSTSGKNSALLNIMACFMSLFLFAISPRYASMAHFSRIPVGQAVKGVNWHALHYSRYRGAYISKEPYVPFH